MVREDVRIKLYRKLKSHGVSLYAVAKAGGWSWQTVAAWMKGDRSILLANYFRLRNVCKDFGIDMTEEDLQMEEGGDR